MPRVIAHRGASAAAPENTVDAFRLAHELGADWVELDARRTIDGAIVVAHDAHLADGRLIAATAAADLPPSMPGLAHALDACDGMGVNIEIKNHPVDPDFDPDESVAAAVVAEVQRRADHAHVLVSSFHLPTVDRVHALDADVPTAFLFIQAENPAEVVTLTRRHGHIAVNPWDALVDAALVERAHAEGLAVNVWTVDDPVRMSELVALGVDGIVTNVPDVARAIVDSRRNS
jgi:glycerophosphoryl diester phosphodiesterase